MIKDPSVKLLFQKCQLVSIVTTLLRANEKESLTTRISNKQTKPISKGLFIFILAWQFIFTFMLAWQRHVRQPSYQKSEVWVVKLRVAIFGDQRIKGFREKGDWNRYQNCVRQLKIRFQRLLLLNYYFKSANLWALLQPCCVQMKKKVYRLEFQTNETDFKRAVYIYSCWHGDGTYVSLAIKTTKFELLSCALPFLATKGSRDLEKKEIETGIKIVFANLKSDSKHCYRYGFLCLNLMNYQWVWNEWN